ncbi:hypothetical protein [Micromonospora sp. NBC_01796]|uniref:hypothetical protein n=1 Tax=Micromonospora sp. NBC_01796 TaxID=2975987 RepID=UPI002DD8053A|nr:hypothetical protein [Micromonospora sp. NBC_01796]WSA83501.1 hypothetical protein OIE47_24280 [Micromonospora sp. NBC_01796]
MNALSETYYSRYARTRAAEAQQAIDRHVVSAYTGVCLGCGRPGPCDERDQAERTLAHYSRRTRNPPPDNRSHPSNWPIARHQSTSAKNPGANGLLNTAIRTADGTVDALRAACLAATEALERASQQVDGVEHPLPRTALANWDSALDLAWEALTTVYSGLAEARRLPHAEPHNIGYVLAGLKAARLGAGRAADQVDRVRRQLSTAEDWLRRDQDDPRALAAAERWAWAGRRLDLVAARLAIGSRALDRYAANLAGTPEPAPISVTVRLDRLLTRARPTVTQTREGATVAARLVVRRHPWGGWRGFMARWRHEAWKEFTRSWTA